VYRVVFNHALKCVQVVSELACGGRSASRTSRRHAPRLAPLFTGIALACMAPGALAAHSEWVGVPGSEWNVPGSWVGGVPTDRGIDTPNDTAYVNSGGVRITGVGVPGADEVHIGYTGAGRLDVVVGGSLDTNTIYMGTQAGSMGLAVIDGSGSEWNARYTIGVGHLGNGDLTIRNGGRMTIDRESYIASMAGSTGVVRVQNAGSEWNTGNSLFAGQGGIGTIEVTDGGTLQGVNAIVGNLFGSVGRITVSGSGSNAVHTGTLTVGNSGQGTYEILDGASAVVGGSINLAQSNSSRSTLTVGQNAILAVGDNSGSIVAITAGFGQSRFELAGGTLRANSWLNLDTALVVSADSILDVADSLRATQTISGTGQLRKTGTGTLMLSGNNTWSGGLRVEQGTLSVGSDAALSLGVLSMADGTSLGLGTPVTLYNTVQLNGEVGVWVAPGTSATLAGNVRDASGNSLLVKNDEGTLVLSGIAYTGDTRVEGGTLLATGNALPTGDIEIGSGGTFAIDTTRVLQYDGQFSGSGTLRQGRHFLTLTGDSSAFTGTTVVNGGMLEVAGALGGDIQMTNNALLAGMGSVGNVELLSGSVLSPGARMSGSIGRLSVGGDLRFDSSATFQVDVAANGSSDFVGVGGKAFLGNAGTVAVAAAGNWGLSTRYTLISAGAGVDGTFAGVSSNFAFLDPSLSYDANNVYLTMTRNDVSMPDVELAFPEVVVNTNQQQVAGAVEALGEGNAVYDAVVRLTVPEVVPAFDSLSGEVHAATRGALLQNRFLHDGIDRHLDGRALSGAVAPGVNLWLAGSGGQLRTDATAENAASRVQQHGLMAGAGWQVGETLELGVAAGQQKVDNRLRERAAVAETDATEYGVYAHYRWQGLSLRGGVTRADYRTDTTRTAQVGTAFSEQLLAREDATGTTAFVRAGWSFGGPRLQLTPEIELAQVRLESDGSQERGGNSALRLASADSEYRTGLAALKADWDISGGLQDRAVLSARVGWQYADGDRLPTATARFVGGSQDFTIAGAPLARSSVLAQLGVAVSPSANSRVSLQVQGRDGDGQRDVGAQLDWSVAF
jgi:T5SS/PEP-CTERM-associated repeat protein/autotransporter-associated beta strand protein